LVVTEPREDHEFIAKTVRDKKQTCGLGEKYDSDLNLCAPITNTPIPILSSMLNNNIDKCHSFFNHMNGHWITNHTNENRAFSFVYRKNMKQIHDIIKDPKSGPIYKFYRSCRDTLVHKQHKYETNNQVKHVMENILGALKTHADLPVVFARLAKNGYNSPFSVVIEKHPTKNEMIPLFRFDTVPDFSNKLTKKIGMWKTVFEETTEQSFFEYVKSLQFEHDQIKFGDLIDAAPKKFWKEYLTELNGISSLESELIANKGLEKVWVLDKSYFMNLLSNLKTFPIEQWKEFVKASIDYNTKDYMPVLPSDSYFRVHDVSPIGPNVFVNGKKTTDDITDTHCLMATHKLLPGIIAKEYLKRDMKNSEKTRARLKRMTVNLRDTYSQLVNETPWMSLQTKRKSVEKLKSIIIRIIHPNTWETEDFSQRIQIDRYLHNLNMVRRYRAQRNFELWTSTRKGMNRDSIQRFGAPLSTVNAYYSPSSNTITVFGGIVTDPFYDKRFSDVSMYASLGMIISHELGHALDNSGRKFDLNGNLKKWWSDDDIAAFERQTKCVVREYKPPIDCEVENYGEKTLGESKNNLFLFFLLFIFI